MDKTPLLLSIQDAAAALGIRKSKLYQLIAAGKLTRVYIGRRALITRASLEAFAAEVERGAA